MIDGNISMEEDTELRDLVVQTLENNGVLAKVRAELRASVFLALEEQDSVMNPEPLLNKTVKQYLSNSEGKLLFCLVREFLEYFGLDCTISVYDPETYFGKEYNYVGRNKLCEELGIDSTEPLLGEILKNSINGAFNSTQKSNKSSNRHDETDETSTNFVNTTFEVSVPKIIHNESVSSSNDNDSSEKLESVSEQSPKVPINVTITDKKCKDPATSDVVTNMSDCDKQQSALRENATDNDGIESNRNNNVNFDKTSTCTTTTTNVAARENDTTVTTSNQTSPLNKSESLIKFDDSIVIDTQTNQKKDITKQNSINSLELSLGNNVHTQHKKPVNAGGNFGKTIFFDEIIVDGERKNVSTMHKAESFLEDLPAINQKAGSIFGDLPPLNGKKANINDLKELMDIGLATDGIDNYEEDFVSSASGSANEQSPSKEPDKIDSSPNPRTKKEEKTQSARTEDLSEEIEEMDEILSSTSCKSRNLEYRIDDWERQQFFVAVQQMELDDGAQNSNNAEPSLLRTKGKVKTSACLKKNSTFGQADTNKCGNDDTCVNERCEHSLNIPPKVSQSSCRRVSQNGLTEYEFDIDIVQAIVYLKSITVSQLSTKRLQQIYNSQWSTQDNHTENEGRNEQQSTKHLKCLNIEKPSTSKVIDTQDILMLTPRNVTDLPCNSPPGGLIRSLSTSKEAEIDVLSFGSMNNINKSPVSSVQNKWDSYIMESDSGILAMDKKLSFNSNFDANETFDSLAEFQMYNFKLDKITEYLTPPTWDYAERANEEVTRNMVDTANVPGNDFADPLFPWKASCTQTTDQNEQHKLTSSTPKQSDETNNFFQLRSFFDEAFITPNVITQPTPHSISSPTFNYSSKNLNITPLDNLSLGSIDSKLNKLQDFDNFQTGNHSRSRTDVYNNDRSSFKIKFDDLNKSNTPVSNVRNSRCDSAYGTEIHHCHVDETTKPAANKGVSHNNTRHCYNLRSSKKKETAMNSIEVMCNRMETLCIKYKEQPSVKKRSCLRKWLDFNQDYVMEYIILESVRVILTTVSDEKMAEEYATYRRWKNNLIGKAVNAVLNMSDALRLEGKPDICRKPIITMVTETLDKIATCMRSNKAYLSQVYRVQIILELCNSVSVCVATIDHLIARLKSFWSMLSQETEIRRDIRGTVNQLHFVFYALNIALRKYRAIVPNDGKAAEISISQVADLWKTRYIDEKLRHAKLNVNDVEERWRIVLEDLTVASTEDFIQFAAKELLSSIHVLNSQFRAKRDTFSAQII
ncbi:uncharacterized protein LOC116841970 [Odontomachus brunneus]|uniref:uncharacterized protein LOC116841970 n=1 Tax=Odontomachus brunneus TaxID=486640 RepID=UPI0013F2A407|nr:uncharacterized protein LOC116841970 [Odontomachus brunneus]